MKKRKKTNEEIVREMNEGGLVIYEGVVVTCAETGRIWSVEYVSDGDSGHAELTPDGRIVFIPHFYDEPEDDRVLH